MKTSDWRAPSAPVPFWTDSLYRRWTSYEKRACFGSCIAMQYPYHQRHGTPKLPPRILNSLHGI